MRILIFVFFTVFSIPNEINQLNEIIRQKVEKLPIFRALNSQYEIFCIPSIREVYLNNEFNPFWTDEYQVNDLISMIEQNNRNSLRGVIYKNVIESVNQYVEDNNSEVVVLKVSLEENA